MADNYYTQWGVDLSLYSGKTRSYLRYKNIPFVEKAPSAITYYWTIKRHTGDAVVPAVVTPEGEWLQDTSTIIDRLEERYPEPAVVPDDPVKAFAAYLLEMWGDEFWLPTAMHYRWSYPENRQLFLDDAGSAFFPGFPGFFQRFAAGNAAKNFGGFLPRLGVVPEQVPLLERWSLHHLDALDEHFSATPYLFGTRPSLGDYGLIGPLFAHLGRDPWPKKNLIEPRHNLHSWIERMMNPEPCKGAFDEGPLPESLTPMLRSIFDEMLPFLEAIAEETRRELSGAKPGAEIPRMLAPVEFPLLDGSYRRDAFPYLLWMAQRALDWLHGLSTRTAGTVRNWLKSLGGEAFLCLDIPRLRRIGLRVAAEN